MQCAGFPRSRDLHLDLMKESCRASNADFVIGQFDILRAEGWAPDSRTIDALIEAYLMKGDIDTALEIVEQMIRRTSCKIPHPHDLTYVRLINTCVKANRLDDALQLYHNMRISGRAPHRATYTSLINAVAHFGSPTTAESIFRDMLRIGIQPTARQYNILIWLYVHRLNDAEGMQKIVEEMHEKGVKPTTSTFNIMLDGFVKRGDLDSAIELLEGFPVQPDVVSYTTVLKGLSDWERGQENGRELE
ncbi:hypothetical protein HK097_009242, partial [Rhizophlyctis rosea]